MSDFEAKLKKKLEREWRKEHRAKNLSKLQAQEYARQNRRRGRIIRYDMYYRMVLMNPGRHVPDDDVAHFEDSVKEAGRERAEKWYNGMCGVAQNGKED